jgi:hypothetical protein
MTEHKEMMNVDIKKPAVMTFQRDRLSLSVIEPNILPMGKIILNLLKNPSFMLSTLAIANVMFVLTAA